MNKMVSIRQMSRMLFLELFGLGTLILPGPLAIICQNDGIFAILIAAGIWAGIVWALCKRLLRNMHGEALENEKNNQLEEDKLIFDKKSIHKRSVLIEKIKAAFQVVIFALAAGFLFYLLVSLVERQLLDSNYLWIIVITIFLAGGYGILKGIQVRARIYEILFWILLVPLGAILLIAVWNIHPDYWLPVFASNWKWFILGIAVCMAAFLPAVLCVFLLPSCMEPQRVGTMVARMVWWAGVGCACVYLILLGIFQADLLSVLKYPIISLMSVVQMPGNLMERLDAPMVAIWFFALFALFHSLSYYCVNGIQKLFPGGKKNGRKVWVGMILILISSLLLLLQGCGKKGPESAMYPMVIGIEENEDMGKMTVSYAMPPSGTGKGPDEYITIQSDSLFQAEEQLALESEKTLDLNHMKVFIVSRELLLDKKQKELLFAYFLENENMAWNTCLLFTEEKVEDLFQEELSGDTSMGSYLEDLLKSREDMKAKSVFTVKDFMSLYQNQTETMLAPIVSVKDGKLAIESYCLISRCGDRGTILAEDGAYIHMLLNKQKTLPLGLEADEYAMLQDIRMERQLYEDNNGNPRQEIVITANLKLSADWLFDREEKDLILETARQKVEERLNDLVSFYKMENHTDLTNSFLALSGHDRKLWKLYRDNPDAYEKKLRTTIAVKLKMLDT